METIDKITSLKQYFLMNMSEATTTELILHLSQLNLVDVFYINHDLKILEYYLLHENQRFYKNTLESGFLELSDFSFDITTPIVKKYDIGQRALLFDKEDWAIFTTVCSIPVVKSKREFEYLVLLKYNNQLNDDFIYFAEVISLLFSIVVQNKIKNKEQKYENSIRSIQIALDALSYSEKHAMKLVLDKIEGEEGHLVASKVAREHNITRSIIVNALRKLESAGLLKSKSLGMRGTHIKILNNNLKTILNIDDVNV